MRNYIEGGIPLDATVTYDLIASIFQPGSPLHDGAAGYWIVGRPHEVMLVDRHGRPFPETVRLAGNTLVWQRGELTMRIEGRFGKAKALRIARSVR